MHGSLNAQLYQHKCLEIENIGIWDITDGFPEEWTTSVVIPPFKSGDTNNPSNYHTIMVNPLMGKLFGSMIERRTNRWEKDEGKEKKCNRDLGLSTLLLTIVSPLDI